MVHVGASTCTHTHLSLEGTVERCEEVRTRGQGQHPLLHHGALRVLVLEEDVFLQHFYCKQPLAASLFCQQHLEGRFQEQQNLYISYQRRQKEGNFLYRRPVVASDQGYI